VVDVFLKLFSAKNNINFFGHATFASQNILNPMKQQWAARRR